MYICTQKITNVIVTGIKPLVLMAAPEVAGIVPTIGYHIWYVNDSSCQSVTLLLANCEG